MDIQMNMDRNRLNENRKREIKAVFEKICQAFAASDLDSALSYFADQDEMVKISNGRVLRGKKELADYWRQHLGNQEGPRISIHDLEMHPIDETHVWTVAKEQIALGGQTIWAVVTNLLVLTDSGWKILLDHTSPLGPE